MFLLFFLMVAAGMLGLLWLYFPVQAGPPTESPLPPRQQVTAPGLAAPEPAVPTVSTADPSSDAATPVTAADAPSRAPATPDAPGSAVPTIEELDRQLDKLLGLPPSSGTARP